MKKRLVGILGLLLSLAVILLAPACLAAVLSFVWRCLLGVGAAVLGVLLIAGPACVGRAQGNWLDYRYHRDRHD